jgi:hypothetical protein
MGWTDSEYRHTIDFPAETPDFVTESNFMLSS